MDKKVSKGSLGTSNETPESKNVTEDSSYKTEEELSVENAKKDLLPLAEEDEPSVEKLTVEHGKKDLLPPAEEDEPSEEDVKKDLLPPGEEDEPSVEELTVEDVKKDLLPPAEENEPTLDDYDSKIPLPNQKDSKTNNKNKFNLNSKTDDKTIEIEKKDSKSNAPTSKLATESSLDEFSPLVQKVEQTLEDIKRASLASGREDDPELDDDEPDPKNPPPDVQKRKMSKVVTRMISDDMEKIYRQSKTRQEEDGTDRVQDQGASSSEKAPVPYDLEQASLMGAVLGIGERDKSKDNDLEAHSNIGTLAGLGDITDTDADLREHDSSEEKDTRKDTAEEFAKRHLIIQADAPSTSQVGEDDLLKLRPDSEELIETEKKETKKSSCLMEKIRNLWRNCFKTD